MIVKKYSWKNQVFGVILARLPAGNDLPAIIDFNPKLWSVK